MKKIAIASLAIALFGGMALAESIQASYGVNFFMPTHQGMQTKAGTNFLISWTLDNDLSLGYYTEDTNLQQTAPAAVAGSLALSGIQVAKGVVKNVKIAVGVYSGFATLTGSVTQPAVDVIGIVTLLQGKGDKVSGSLDAILASRYMRAGTIGVSDLNGFNAGLAAGISF